MKGRRPKAPEGVTPDTPYKIGEFIVTHNGKLGLVTDATHFGCSVILTNWTKVFIPNASIDSAVPEDTAKTLWLLQTGEEIL